MFHISKKRFGKTIKNRLSMLFFALQVLLFAMTADESLGCGALEGTGLPGVGRSLEERDVISFNS